ncbi:MAG: hypothetical protein LBS59_06825 [Puniceicoccales bacterium]|jgi:hypothetical protein|nr:hypothetical protein [Puniceicoccales bacterium]
MEKHSHKLLLFIALLLCIAGFGVTGWFHTEGRHHSAAEKVAKKQENPNPYVPLALPPVLADSKAWVEPVRTDEDDDEYALWTYDLFTPVQIHWNNASRTYYPKGLPNEPEPPFGIKLSSMSRPVYRFTLSGEGPDRTAFLLDSEFYDKAEQKKGKVWRVQKGKSLKSGDIDLQIIDFIRTRKKNEKDGSVAVEKTLVVQDNKLKREIRLKEGVPYEFLERTNIEVTRTDNPEEKWIWKQIGDQIKLENVGTFVLKEFDFDAKTVTVEKTYEKANKTNTRKIQKKQTETLQMEIFQQKPPNAERRNQPTVANPSTNTTNP